MASQVVPQEQLLPSDTIVLETLASADAQWTQRKLAHQTGYSIGLINTILKRLSKTGYIKVATIDRRRLQYLLTPQGLAATSRVAYNYILRTFRDYQQLYVQISNFFQNLSAQGYHDLCVSCDDPELKQLLHVVMNDCGAAAKINLHESENERAIRVHLKGAMVTGVGPRLDMTIISSANGGMR